MRTIMSSNHERYAFAAVIALCVISLAACGGRQKTQASSAQPEGGPEAGAAQSTISVKGAAIAEGALIVKNVTAGTVDASLESKVAARTAGTVAKVYGRSGDWVQAGDRVIQLDDTQLKLEVKTAQSNLDVAKIDMTTQEDTTSQDSPKLELQVSSAEAALSAARKKYDGLKAQLEIGGATATEVDTALSGLQTAQATLQEARTSLDQNKKAPVSNLAKYRISVEKAENSLLQAQTDLRYATIVAPFAGQISSVEVSPGEYVQASSTVFSLVSAEREIHFNVPPNHAARLAVKSPLTFTLDGKDYSVSVKQAPSAPVNGVVPMIATAPAIKVSYGRVGTLGYSVTLGRGTLVPLSALKSTEDTYYVFACENGKAVQKQVVLVAESGVTAAVTGIRGGTVVIDTPPPGLLDGADVSVVGQGGEGQPE